MQMTLKFLFILSKDTGWDRQMYLKSDNIIVMLGREVNYSLRIIFNSIISKCQNDLLEEMNVSEFIFDNVSKPYLAVVT